MKFLHAADIHLDSPLKGLEQYEGAPVEAIRLAARHALTNLVDLALDEEVDFVLIAGDLYDGDWKDHNTGLFFVSQVSRLREADIPVVMIAGNHDAASKMTKSLRLPQNVELLSHKKAETAASQKLRDLGVAVHGRSFGKEKETDNFACDYPAFHKGMFNIGLLHTALSGIEGHEPYAPCTLDELRQKGYDYWALGHVHQRRLPCTDPPIVFPGNIQGRHIRETGAKGCYLVSVEGNGAPQLEFRTLDVFRWNVCEVVVPDAQCSDDFYQAFEGRIADLADEHDNLPFAVRVVLGGPSAAHEPLASDPIGCVNELRAIALDRAGGRIWVEKVKFKTLTGQTLDPAADSDGPIGEMLRYLEELRRNPGELVQLANTELKDLFKKLPAELTGGIEPLSVNDPGQVCELLNEIQPLLMGRLVEER